MGAIARIVPKICALLPCIRPGIWSNLEADSCLACVLMSRTEAREVFTFTVQDAHKSWNDAFLSGCGDSTGTGDLNLAVLNTQEKQLQLVTEMNSSMQDSECYWVGAEKISGTWVWHLNGSNVDVSSGYENWDLAHPRGTASHMCIRKSGEWESGSNEKKFICEQQVCDAGYFRNFTCKRCKGIAIKRTSGDEDCDEECRPGDNTVPNAGHTDCVCSAGRYAQGESCKNCKENTIKSSPGNATGCNETCDGATITPNDRRTACVCKAGYYRNGNSCYRCTGNTIKRTKGDATDCTADPPCDGVSTVPNDGHTECQCNAGHYRNGNSGCSKCSGNLIKSRPGNNSACEEECNVLQTPNEQHSACVCQSGYAMNGGTCSPCVELISGSGGEKMIDGNAWSCTTVPHAPPNLNATFALALNGNCTAGRNTTVKVTTMATESCDHVVSTMLAKRLDPGCNSNYNACALISKDDVNDMKECTIKCKCPESPNQCFIHMYSGLNTETPDVNICEFVVD